MCCDSKESPYVTLITSPRPFPPFGLGPLLRPLVKLEEENKGLCYTGSNYSAKRGESMPRATQIMAKLRLEARPPSCQPRALSAMLYVRYRVTGQRKI